MRHPTRYHPAREYRTEPSEDSDIIVALFRSAVIIAFAVRLVPDPNYTVRPSTWTAVVVAALYTLALMLGYLASRRWLTRRRKESISSRPLWGFLMARRIAFQRTVALLVDLVMVSFIIRDVDKPEWLDIYYLIVAVGAVWFHRGGGVLTALGATGCVIWFTLTSHPGTGITDWALRMEITTRAAILVTVGVVTGWLARARDAERRTRERMDWEMRMARSVQRELLPAKLPEVPGYELGLRFSPAGLVGGDYYDAFITPDNRLVIVLADVAGKSVAAVLHLSLLRSHLRQAINEALSPREIGTRLNAALVDALPPRSFVGLFCGALDAPSGRLTYVNCGHTPPVLVRGSADEEPIVLYTGNIVLGVMVDPTYDEREVTLEGGDILICCTDGVTEAMDGDWQAFDTKGVIRAAEAARGANADEVVGHVLDASRQHAARRPTDDATLLAIRRVPSAG